VIKKKIDERKFVGIGPMTSWFSCRATSINKRWAFRWAASGHSHSEVISSDNDKSQQVTQWFHATLRQDSASSQIGSDIQINISIFCCRTSSKLTSIGHMHTFQDPLTQQLELSKNSPGQIMMHATKVKQIAIKLTNRSISSNICKIFGIWVPNPLPPCKLTFQCHQ